jgi:hypothetical protein
VSHVTSIESELPRSNGLIYGRTQHYAVFILKEQQRKIKLISCLTINIDNDCVIEPVSWTSVMLLEFHFE